ncbi:MAG: GNAT family N-acetyltransferase [Caldilineaceae bacterium]|nr:GNAT family N-acetyltransferase [Caldilineaceae bacterium]
MTESMQTTTPAPPPEQLRMIWPNDRLESPPSVTIHPDYDLRTFRPDSAEDMKGWCRLMELAGFGLWDEQRLAPIYARILPNGWFFAVHRETGSLAASAMACHEPHPLHPFGGALNWVCGDPAHRGKGLGMTVCAAVTARLLAGGYENVFLITDDFRLPALSIYLRLGYRPLLFAPDMEKRWRAVYEQLGRTDY